MIATPSQTENAEFKLTCPVGKHDVRTLYSLSRMYSYPHEHRSCERCRAVYEAEGFHVAAEREAFLRCDRCGDPSDPSHVMAREPVSLDIKACPDCAIPYLQAGWLKTAVVGRL